MKKLIAITGDHVALADFWNTADPLLPAQSSKAASEQSFQVSVEILRAMIQYGLVKPTDGLLKPLDSGFRVSVEAVAHKLVPGLYISKGSVYKAMLYLGINVAHFPWRCGPNSPFQNDHYASHATMTYSKALFELCHDRDVRVNRGNVRDSYMGMMLELLNHYRRSV